MKMLVHLIIYLVMFSAGFGVGIFYYEKHPEQGSNLVNIERTAKLQGQIEIYKHLLETSQSNQTPEGQAKTKEYQDALDKARADLSALPPVTLSN